MHKCICHGYRDIEIIQFPVIFFAVYKLHDVRVIDPQDGHIRTTPGAPLFHLFGRRIKDLHKGDRA